MSQNISRRNHYIPQFYLRNWSLDGKTIQTYSILVSNANVPYWTKQSIKNTAVWNDFYTRSVGDEELDDFEHWFDREFERPAKPIFDKLLNGERLLREEIRILSRFVFAQYCRTPSGYFRLIEQNAEKFSDTIDDICRKSNRASRRKLQRSVLSPTINAGKGDVPFPLKVTLDKEKRRVEVKTIMGKGVYLHGLKHLLTSKVEVAERLDWQVLHAADGISFPTSDDPVICLDCNNEGYSFGGGWGKKHSNILMPISPKLILFSEVGEKGVRPDLDYSPAYSRLFREIIIRHAHRYVYADRPQRGMLALNARVVDREMYEREQRSIAGWHAENIRAEQSL